MRIAVFGGTFNPPHLGHTNLAKAVVSRGLVDKILFIPAYMPPHKLDWDMVGFDDRLNMLKLAAGALMQAEVSDIESRRPDEPSYTVVTLELLQQLNPEDELVLLIGEDSLQQLHTWSRAVELAEKWEIMTYPRPPLSVSLEDLRRDWPEALADKLYSSKVELPLYEVSSTEIRHALKHGLDVGGMLDEEVMKYIEEKSLYQWK